MTFESEDTATAGESTPDSPNAVRPAEVSGVAEPEGPRAESAAVEAPTEQEPVVLAEPDGALLAAHDLAYAALLEITPAATIGKPAGHVVEADGVVSLVFETTLLGYPGWFWTVSLARVDGEEPTVLEAELLPGEKALVAPEWVPWAVRLAEYQAAQAAAAELSTDEAENDDSDDLDDDDDLDDSDDDLDDDELDFDPDDMRSEGDDDLNGIDIDALGDADADIDDDDDDDDDDVDDDDDDDDVNDDDDVDDDDSDEAPVAVVQPEKKRRRLSWRRLRR